MVYQGIGLGPSTANDRTTEATNFLRWAFERGLRGRFDVKSFFRAGPQHMELAPRTVRAGRAKEDLTSRSAASFILPEAEEVRDWLRAVRKARGYAKYLACKFVIDTGARRMEVEALRVGQWPKAEKIEYARSRRQESVTMRLVMTKGGRPRTIRVSVEYAQEVRDWIDHKRSTYEYRYFKLHGRRTDRLFLSDHPEAGGNPISAQTIYRCFSEVEPHPPGWSPHKGRHAFACFWTLYALSTEAEAQGGLTQMGAGWINSRGDFWLKSLRRQFGHVSQETTQLYLEWLRDAYGIAALASGWHRFLEGGSDE